MVAQPSIPNEPSPARKRTARVVLLAVAAAGPAVFFLLLWRSAQIAAPGGLIGHIVGSLIACVVVWGCGAWAALSLLIVDAPLSGDAPPPLDAAIAADLASAVGPVLEELEKIRVAAMAKVRTRLTVGLPLGALAGLGIGLLARSGRKDPMANIVLLMILGAAAGFHWATRKAIADYRNSYLTRVLPIIAMRLGSLACRLPAQLDLTLLSDAGLFSHYDEADAELEIFGKHRGLPISIATLELKSNAGKKQKVEFNGLIVQLGLPRGLTGTTAVLHRSSAWRHLAASLKARGAQPVHLEDADFRAVYDVSSTDQVAARALLTPAFMARFLAMGRDPAMLGDRPVALLRDGDLLIAIPRVAADGFATPSLRTPSVGRRAVVELYNHLAAVLALTDTAISLDSAAQGVALSSDVRKPSPPSRS